LEFNTNSRHPRVNGAIVKLKFIVQVTTAPPTFVISSNFTDLESNYVSLIKKSISEKFNLNNIPIRLIIKKQNNPFLKNDSNGSKVISTRKTGAKISKRRRFN